MTSLCLLLGMLLQASPLAEPGPVSGRAVETEEDRLVQDVSDALRRDGTLRRGLARRILASSLGAQFSEARDPAGAVASWIEDHPTDGAQLAVGFAKDDRDGTRQFEDSLTSRVQRYFELNPKRHEGILGTLNAAGSASRSILLQENLSEEERRELLKRFFEGQGSESGKVLTETASPHTASPPTGDERVGGTSLAAFAGAGMADRLSALNPTGYSPSVVTYQNGLNARRPPGAPRLVETGKLDHSTLVFPLYGLLYDMRRLEEDLARRRAWNIAKALGRDLKPAQYADPAVRSSLEKGAAGLKLPPGFERRRKALEEAAASVEDFRREAAKTKDLSRVTPALLKELGRRQKEAARWLAIASLEADLQRLEEEGRFWDRELDEAIRAAPLPEETRAAYSARGQALKERLQRAGNEARQALEILSGPDYIKRWPEAEKRSAAALRERGGLAANLSLYRAIPFRLNAAHRRKSSWQVFLDRWVRRLAPKSAWARRLSEEERRFSALAQAFTHAAAGDFRGAQRAAGL